MLSASDHYPPRTQLVKQERLPHRVAFAQDQRGLVGVGNEDVGVWEDDLERLEIPPRARWRHVEHRHRSGWPRPPEAIGQLAGVQARENQEVTDMQDARRALEPLIEIGSHEPGV